ncbi:MAG: MBOAT family protein [Chitinophagaceae bacterium]|nr:MAG: MBOAT family protein [Chitinophagaceae bacterium]
MLFNSYEFIFFFLPISIVMFYLIGRKNHRYACLWLTAVSFLFYSIWSLNSLPVLVLSIVVNYCFGKGIFRSKSVGKKHFLVGGIIFNLLTLCYFKYSNFFLENVNILLSSNNSTQFTLLNIILPIGISFFTFTQIAYLIDCYDRNISEYDFYQYCLFVTFFPHLIAGPLINHKNMMPQFSDPEVYRFKWSNFQIGIAFFSIGLSKKLLLADQFAPFADALFNSAKSGTEPQLLLSWLGSLSYTFQLYFDFSGYSDMAIGLSLFFGIYLPINFNAPFKAKNIIDFWQRWHMTLTNYIGRYLYTPFTLLMTRRASRKNQLMKSLYKLVIPTLVTFTLIGFWHGPSWHYVGFGLMHGIFIVINHLWKKRSYLKNTDQFLTLTKYISWLVTFLAVNCSFVMFRSEDIPTSIKIYKGLIGVNGLTLPNFLAKFLKIESQNRVWQSVGPPDSNAVFILTLFLAFLIVLKLPSSASLLPGKRNDHDSRKLLKSKYAPIILSILFVLSILNLGKTSAFLYFQF